MSGSNNARRRARRRRSIVRGTLAAVALMATGAVVFTGLQSREPDRSSTARPTPTPSPTPTPLASLDLSGLPIQRAPFCDELDQGDVEDALGGPVSGTAHYDSGDRVALAAGLTDVSHEFGCTFDAATGAQARAWVFAEPVTVPVGRSIIAETRSGTGCTVVGKAPTFGTPSVGTLCRTGKPAGQVVTLRGLFGDAWLSCQLSTPGATGADQTVQRAEQWCVRVATTLGARP
jgi:hypothetical protein